MLRSRPKLVLAISLFVVNTVLLYFLPGYRYRGIVIHHTASSTDNYASIREQHRGRGWWEVAYHLILSNGSTEIPAGHLEATRRYRFSLHSAATKATFCNLTAVHLSVVGNFETSEFPESLRPALAHAVARLKERYGISDERIHLHRDCNNTACPGKNVTNERLKQWLATEVTSCPPELRRQHDGVLDQALLERRSWPLSAAAAVPLTGLLLLVGRRRRRGRRRKPSRKLN